MNKKAIKGLREISENYDVFFIDIWGVIHNGIELYDGAIEVLENLNKIKKKYVLMSNAPRPSKNVEKFLLKLKMKKIYTKNIFTSGEAALKTLQKNIYGKYFYHLGPHRDKSLFKNFEKNKTTLDKAEFILCTGLLDEYENSLDYYKNLLKNYTQVKMVCTNPDLDVFRGSKKEYCAGTIAALFEGLGGTVIYFGKPYPEIYKFCHKEGDKVLVVGDNIRTDIKGANNMNFDSLFITGGIHKNEFINLKPDDYKNFLAKYSVKINYYQDKFKW